MSLPTLLNTRSPLASPAAQRARLEALPLATSFGRAVAGAGHGPLLRAATEVLQVNLGKRCNQACHHCHVDAGPDRTEVMTDDVVEQTLTFLARTTIPTLDITGGAPELHPRFRAIVERGHALGRRVIDRCNLTIVTLPNYADLPEFLARHQVEVTASLPSYAAAQTDRQRGDGVFGQSIDALRAFNAAGYGDEDSGLVLNLVTNPVGAFLPAHQASLERDWKRELHCRHGVRFNRLFTITNMPISRYLDWLERSGNLEAYMAKLVDAFNPAAVDGVMCRTTLSVGWDGRVYDCDFNQMLDLPIAAAQPTEPRRALTIADLASQSAVRLALSEPQSRITVAPHCFGCTAGAGSSCGGATAVR